MRRVLCICICALVALGFLWREPTGTLSHHALHYVGRPAPANFDIMAPTLYPTQNHAWIAQNQETTHALFRCIERADCAQNQTKVVIITSYEFALPMQGSNVGGEAVWAFSTLRALDNMGYSVLYAPNVERAIQLYHLFHALVRIVITHPAQANECWAHTGCARTRDNPAGIPVWKIFSFYFWHEVANPLGAKWTLNPEDYELLGHAPNTYLGYSIESQCRKRPFVPHAERSGQAYILAKTLDYFRADARAWPPAFFDAASNATGLAFVAGAKGALDAVPELASSITNVGPLPPDEFYAVLSKSAVLVGMGDPALSPTPYDALCLGIPFINPVKSWDRANPSDRTKWHTQHNALKQFSAPYVYHVFKDDRAGFVQAVSDAKSHPIQSFVPERMKMAAVERRLGAILEHDWRAEAADLLEQRAASDQGPTFIL
ncbi:hypothetical protein FB451DRAFT_1140209 [Mycena latifolia]|nr:hypothetical protein FB451DRAFT_1140209 [Mycena latifolia]